MDPYQPTAEFLPCPTYHVSLARGMLTGGYAVRIMLIRTLQDISEECLTAYFAQARSGPMAALYSLEPLGLST